VAAARRGRELNIGTQRDLHVESAFAEEMNGRDIALISFGAFLAISAIYTFGAAPSATSCQPSLCSAVTQAPAASPSPRNIYFDIGANNGESITSFLAARPGLEWDVVLVEATPRFTEQLKELCTEVSSTGAARSCLPLVETALTTFDGFVDIFVEETRLEHDASSIVAGAHVRDGPGSYFNASAVDVVTLFRQVFPVYEEDNVVVKMTLRAQSSPLSFAPSCMDWCPCGMSCQSSGTLEIPLSLLMRESRPLIAGGRPASPTPCRQKGLKWEHGVGI